jgi:hypothetical protein
MPSFILFSAISPDNPKCNFVFEVWNILLLVFLMERGKKLIFESDALMKIGHLFKRPIPPHLIPPSRKGAGRGGEELPEF